MQQILLKHIRSLRGRNQDTNEVALDEIKK